MSDLNQLLLKFDYEQNFNDDDFYVSKSNKHVLEILNRWPKWEKNFLNICGEKYSGKTHLVNIFMKKFGGFKIESKELNENILTKIKVHQNIILENIDKNINEKLFYSLINIIDQDNKYLITTSNIEISNISFALADLKSRTKNFILVNLDIPDDNLISALLLKNLSDRQISIDKKLIHFIIKRIDRSYSKIFDFIYKIDEVSLKKKKSIDFKIIKEVLGD